MVISPISLSKSLFSFFFTRQMVIFMVIYWDFMQRTRTLWDFSFCFCNKMLWKLWPVEIGASCFFFNLFDTVMFQSYVEFPGGSILLLNILSLLVLSCFVLNFSLFYLVLSQVFAGSSHTCRYPAFVLVARIVAHYIPSRWPWTSKCHPIFPSAM